MMAHLQTVEHGVRMFSQMNEEAVVDLRGVAAAHLNHSQHSSTSIVPVGMLLTHTLTCNLVASALPLQ
jgi:hypothetical protein